MNQKWKLYKILNYLFFVYYFRAQQYATEIDEEERNKYERLFDLKDVFLIMTIKYIEM